MDINYKITKKDYWEYNKYSILNVPKIRMIFIGTPLLIFCLTLAAGLIFKLDMWIILLISVGVPSFYILTVFFPMMFSVMKLPEEKLVNHKITLNEEKGQIIVEKEGGKTAKYSKKDLMMCKKTKNYVFVTSQGFSGIIIPKSEQYTLDEVYNFVMKNIFQK